MKRVKLISSAFLIACMFIMTGCFPDDFKNERPDREEIKPEPLPDSGSQCDKDGEDGKDEYVELELNVVGRYLQDAEVNIVNLHGFGQTYSPFFNGFAWNNYDVEGCLRHNLTYTI